MHASRCRYPKPLLIFLCWLAPIVARSAAADPMAEGQIVAKCVEGEVQDRRNETVTFLRDGDPIGSADVVITGAESSVVLVFSNGATVQLEPRSELAIDKFLQDPFAEEELEVGKLMREPSTSQTRLQLTRGELVAHVRKLHDRSTYEVATPVGAAGIRGTTFRVEFQPEPNASSDAVLNVGTTEGLVLVTASPRGRPTRVPVNRAVEVRQRRTTRGLSVPRTRAMPLPAPLRAQIDRRAQRAKDAAATVKFTRRKKPPAPEPPNETNPNRPVPAGAAAANEPELKPETAAKTTGAPATAMAAETNANRPAAAANAEPKAIAAVDAVESAASTASTAENKNKTSASNAHAAAEPNDTGSDSATTEPHKPPANAQRSSEKTIEPAEPGPRKGEKAPVAKPANPKAPKRTSQMR